VIEPNCNKFSQSGNQESVDNRVRNKQGFCLLKYCACRSKELRIGQEAQE
jgi:hypothetical protein